MEKLGWYAAARSYEPFQKRILFVRPTVCINWIFATACRHEYAVSRVRKCKQKRLTSRHSQASNESRLYLHSDFLLTTSIFHFVCEETVQRDRKLMAKLEFVIFKMYLCLRPTQCHSILLIFVIFLHRLLSCASCSVLYLLSLIYRNAYCICDHEDCVIVQSVKSERYI